MESILFRSLPLSLSTAMTRHSFDRARDRSRIGSIYAIRFMIEPPYKLLYAFMIEQKA